MGHTPSTVITTRAPAVLKIGFPYFENKNNTIIFAIRSTHTVYDAVLVANTIVCGMWGGEWS